MLYGVWFPLCVHPYPCGGQFDWDEHLKHEKQRYLNDCAEHKRKANEYRLSKGKGKLPPTPEAVRRQREEPSSPMTDEEPGWTDRWLEGEVEYQGRQVEGLR